MSDFHNRTEYEEKIDYLNRIGNVIRSMEEGFSDLPEEHANLLITPYRREYRVVSDQLSSMLGASIAPGKRTIEIKGGAAEHHELPASFLENIIKKIRLSLRRRVTSLFNRLKRERPTLQDKCLNTDINIIALAPASFEVCFDLAPDSSEDQIALGLPCDLREEAFDGMMAFIENISSGGIEEIEEDNQFANDLVDIAEFTSKKGYALLFNRRIDGFVVKSVEAGRKFLHNVEEIDIKTLEKYDDEVVGKLRMIDLDSKSYRITTSDNRHIKCVFQDEANLDPELFNEWVKVSGVFEKYIRSGRIKHVTVKDIQKEDGVG